MDASTGAFERIAYELHISQDDADVLIAALDHMAYSSLLKNHARDMENAGNYEAADKARRTHEIWEHNNSTTFHWRRFSPSLSLIHI